MMACTRDHANVMRVKVQSVVDPGTYWLIPDEEESSAKKIDQLLTQRIRESHCKYFVPIVNQSVAVMDPTTNLWHRGEVTTIFVSGNNNRYAVFLVDYGIEIRVAHNLVCELPTDEIFESPYHATQFKLYGAVPCSKQIIMCPDMKLVSGISKEWDPIAYTYVEDKAKAATTIYMYRMKGVEICVEDKIHADLHLVIGGQCISLLDDMCINEYAIYDEHLFKKRCGLLKDEIPKQTPAHHPYPETEEDRILFANAAAERAAGIIPTTPPPRRVRLSIPTRKKSPVTPKPSTRKEPRLIPAGMNMHTSRLKTKRVITKRHEHKSVRSTNSSSTTGKHAGTENSPKPTRVVDLSESPKTTQAENPTRVVINESPKTTQTENSPKPTQVGSESPKTANDMSEQLRTVVSPVGLSPDAPYQCVTARGRRFQALFKAREAMKKENNPYMEDASFDPSLASLNISSTNASPSGLCSEIETALDRSNPNDSNSELTPVNSPGSLNNESPSNTSSGNVIRNKFISLLDDLDCA